ncbi:hypothetical protein Tco_1211469 [Tanacetum coccineum]
MIRTLLVSTKPPPTTVQPIQSGRQDVIRHGVGVDMTYPSVLVFSGYDILIMAPSWSLVNAGMDTPYLP